MDADSDAALLARARSDPAAFAQFYERHERLVLRYLGRQVRDPELTADLTAETFAVALAAAQSFDPHRGAAASTWLVGIARHVLLASWRRRRVESNARRFLAMQPVVLHDDQLKAISRLIAEDLLAELGDDERQAVAGRVLDDREYGDLAGELNCSEQVVRQRVSRGLRKLRTALEGDE